VCAEDRVAGLPPVPSTRDARRSICVPVLVETPVLFGTVVPVWPMATLRRRLVCVAVGIAVFLVLEAATTGCQLVHSMAEASAILAGEVHPLAAWDNGPGSLKLADASRWSCARRCLQLLCRPAHKAELPLGIVQQLLSRYERRVAAYASRVASSGSAGAEGNTFSRLSPSNRGCTWM
jgi:hypothetical protein